MKQDFLNYIEETFQFPEKEMNEFTDALSKPLKKTIRVNTNKISIKDFQTFAEKNGWTLSPTKLGENIFYIDREDTSIALGNTLEHIAGYFYVQELAASSSPYYLSEDNIDKKQYTILDMSASPGGKTTQLTEYFPNSIIIANEIDKSRMRQLHENTDRLGAKNVFVTNYDGRHFKNHPEFFDKILLDAPCSGEGTAYKSDDALKYWNLKNIKRIAKLQYQLLESAFVALKVGGELVYSTCTLNRLENEEIINKLTENYGDHFRVISLSDNHIIRSWPHKNNAGGFFVVKLIKKSSVENLKIKEQKSISQGFEKLSSTSLKIVENFLQDQFHLKLSGKFFTYRDEIYYAEIYNDILWETFFLFKTGVKIGKIEHGEFVPNFFLGTNFQIFENKSFEVSDTIIHNLFSGKEETIEKGDGYYQITFGDIPAGIIRVKNGSYKTLLESRFLRKS